MDKIIFNEASTENYNAGHKARVDVVRIAKKMGFCEMDVSFTISNQNAISKAIKYLSFGVNVRKIKDSIIILQHPCRRLMDVLKIFKRNAKTIIIVHDVDGLRYNNKKLLEREVKEFNKADVLIVHNKRMRIELERVGVTSSMIELQLFDYLMDHDNLERERKGQGICFAGNIDKSKFLFKLPNEMVEYGVNLYGVKSDNCKLDERINYFGARNSESLPDEISGEYGLVWDGDDIDLCGGLVGHYLEYNNPHKLSLYCAAAMPVIVWEKSAVVDFVVNNGIGFSVSSLNEVVDKIKKINNVNYASMKNNLNQLSKAVRQGKYMKDALGKAINMIER